MLIGFIIYEGKWTKSKGMVKKQEQRSNKFHFDVVWNEYVRIFILNRILRLNWKFYFANNLHKKAIAKYLIASTISRFIDKQDEDEHQKEDNMWCDGSGCSSFVCCGWMNGGVLNSNWVAHIKEIVLYLILLNRLVCMWRKRYGTGIMYTQKCPFV